MRTIGCTSWFSTEPCLNPPTKNIGSLDDTPDGTSPRLRLSTWRCAAFGDPTPAREGAFDATVILHELTHGLVFRRAGAGSGMTTLESKILTEGWADFVSLALLAPASENPSVLSGIYPYGAYSTHRFHDVDCDQALLTDNYYFGMRYFPYSTDMTKDPLTLTDLDYDRTKAINHQTAHRYPISVSPHNQEYGNPPDELEPDGFRPYDWAHEAHRANQIWCSALWDLRANAIGRLGYVDGNEKALRLVLEGMKCGPLNPTILGSREGIITAASEDPDYPTALREEAWAAFYKRGIGPRAQVTYPIADRFSVTDHFNRADHDLNGLSDLFLQSGTDLEAWSMDDTARIGYPIELSSLPELSSWWVVGTTDVNRDGRLDFFLEDNHFNNDDHFLGYRAASGGNIQALTPACQEDGTWHIVGTADFHRTTYPGVAYRDTQPDLLWQRSVDGMLAVWWMDGTVNYASAYLNPAWPGDGWRVVGTGDFNRDGVTDIVFQHSSLWLIAVWIMKDNGIDWKHSEVVQDSLGNFIYSPGWRVVGTGYVNLDDKLDLLLQNGSQLGVWYLNGTIFSSSASINHSAGFSMVVGPK